MYVKNVKVKNFGTIKAMEHTFTDGLNIIRGSNEAGKSTLVEAILYAMFGASALRGTVEETVRDGCKPADLRVDLDYGEYKVKRTKSSASVVGPGVKISGQANVSGFFYELLGIQKGNERSVLIAEQGKTAGILDGKPGDVSALIEGLAGFDQIDSVIEKIKKEFPSGNNSLLEEMLEEEKGKLSLKEAVEPEDHKGFLTVVKNCEAEMLVLDGELTDLYSSIGSKEKELAKVEAGVKLKEKLTGDIEDVKGGISRLNSNLEQALTNSAVKVPEVGVSIKLVDDYPAAVDEWNLYAEVTSFNWEGDEWDGSRESMDDELSGLSEKIATGGSDLADLKAEIRSVKRKINNDKTCETCGQDITHFHAELNARLENELKEAEVKVPALEAAVAENSATFNIIQKIIREQKTRAKYAGYAVDKEVFPWTLKWPTKAPGQPSKEFFIAAKECIAKSEAIERSIKQAWERSVEIKKTLEEKTEKLGTLEAEFSNLFVQDGSDLKAIIAVLKGNLEVLLVDRKALAEKISHNDKEAARTKAYADALAKEIKELKEKITEIKNRVSEDKDNALILNEARKAKPKVNNKIWTSVLASVSAAFSDMRGYESRVEKTEKGFAVDSIPVHRLSGSAKSIFGIAVRSALRDIFAPAAGFMTLDEVFASMDKDRTALALAAVASIRGQVLLITHEDLSTLSCDNFIDLNTEG